MSPSVPTGRWRSQSLLLGTDLFVGVLHGTLEKIKLERFQEIEEQTFWSVHLTKVSFWILYLDHIYMKVWRWPLFILSWTHFQLDRPLVDIPPWDIPHTSIGQTSIRRDLHRTDLDWKDLYWTYLHWTDLYYTELYWTYLLWTDLHKTELY